MTSEREVKMISSRLGQYIIEIEANFQAIQEDRKNELREVASYISGLKEKGRDVQLTFICSLNSRRSHLSQIWAQTAAFYYGIEKVYCYSGGTEATAFNYRAVDAIKRAGFLISVDGEGDNPVYNVHFSEDAPEIQAFSKIYNDKFNPQSDYAAIMTCPDADKNCPIVFGADKRFPITYSDPKKSDDTPAEAENYDQRCKHIATEMFYLFSKIS